MIDELKAKIVAKLTDEIDGAIPDGLVQSIAGQAVEIIGEALTEVGVALKGVENTDGDD